MSAIKNIVKTDKYQWDNDRATITALTQACRIINDRVATCLPIQRSLLNLILFEIERLSKNQFYLETLYKAMIALEYYGLFRIRELTYSTHVMKAVNVHIATNKEKILIILYSSKMHSLANRPQKVKITSMGDEQCIFCPFIANEKFHHHERQLSQ